MADKPVVHDSATSFQWGVPALVIGAVLVVFGMGGRTPLLTLAGVLVVILGLMWTGQGIVRSARNRDAMARAVLEQRTDRD